MNGARMCSANIRLLANELRRLPTNCNRSEARRDYCVARVIGRRCDQFVSRSDTASMGKADSVVRDFESFALLRTTDGDCFSLVLKGASMTLLMVVMLCVQVTLLGVVVAILREMQCVRTLIAQRPVTLPLTDDETTQLFSMTAYAIWCWRGTGWELDLGSIPKGHESSKCPAFKGSFVGQRIKTECTRR